MKVAFVTVDLYSGREWLMPWRTVIEVCKVMNDRGMEAHVLTMSVAADNKPYLFGEIPIEVAPREFNAFCTYIEDNRYDVVIYPMPWREALKNISAFGKLKCQKIAYIPGGVYEWRNCFSLLKWGRLNDAKPFLLDILTSYKRYVQKMTSLGFHTIVGLSNYTARTACEAGFKHTVSIVPGKDEFENLEDTPEVFERLGICQNEKYLLFTGGPAPTRGSQILLRACERLQKRGGDIPKVFFLLRKDINGDWNLFGKEFNRIAKRTNVHLIDKKVTRNELKTLMTHARGVILPFLIVPSEIPITFLEVLSLGIPIITFRNCGTSEYLQDALLVCKAGNVNCLMENMLRLWNDDNLYESLSKKAISLMQKHPTWDEVGEQWIEVVKRK